MRAPFAALLSASFPFAAIVLAGSTILAFGGDPPQGKTPEAPPPAPVASPRLPDKAPDSPTASAVRISDEIVKACGINEPDAYFAFDSANIRADDSQVLGQVIPCFTSGPLKGRTLKLVGHAAPRGDSDYNMTLGQSRADSVAGYMRSKGMDKGKTEETSRGAMDATGSDDPSWARDRRVDMMLGQ